MMASAFDQTWAFLMDVEGGATVSTDAHGGTTRYGISQNAFPGEDIANLTEAQAQTLFRTNYWEPCHADDLPPSIALALVDSAFNEGVTTAIRLLQQSLGVTADGVMGPVTLSFAQKRSNLNDFLSRRLMRYADGDPRYRRGWFIRVLKLKDAVSAIVPS